MRPTFWSKPDSEKSGKASSAAGADVSTGWGAAGSVESGEGEGAGAAVALGLAEGVGVADGESVGEGIVAGSLTSGLAGEPEHPAKATSATIAAAGQR